MQAYTDDAPQPHAIQTGSPHARYSVITPGNVDWHIENIALEYDWAAAGATAQRNGRADWADWLRTGRANAA